MLKKPMLPVILLTFGFWASGGFQEIAAGVAIFLFGMLMLEGGLKLFSGGFQKAALEKATGSIPKSIGFGIKFGANIGITTGAWLVAGFGLKVKISAYALPMLAIAIVLVFQKNKYVRGAWIRSGQGREMQTTSRV